MSTTQPTSPPEAPHRGHPAPAAAPPDARPSTAPGHDKPNGRGQDHAQAHGDEHAIPADLKQPSTFVVVLVALAFVVLMAVMFVVGLLPHRRQAAEADADAAEIAAMVSMVSAAPPQPAPGSVTVTLPGDARPNQETAIYARVNGYLKSWSHDIQSHVKKDELLAVIDAPDVDAQLDQSRAALDQAKAAVIKAQADLDLAKVTYQRYLDAQKQGNGSVTAQQIDQTKGAYDDAVASLAQAKANVAASAATVQQFAVMQGFEKIAAPFDGVITARTYDVGALVGPTNNGPVLELFRLSQVDPLRVYVNLPQNYAANLKVGQAAILTVRNYPGREFTGKVARTAGQIDAATRTLLVETDFPNPDGTLYAGMYGQVKLIMQVEKPVLLVPTSALVFNASGLRVGVVRDGKVHFQEVSLGRDLGTELEVTTGLTPEDQVITNPGERLTEGSVVRVKGKDQTAGAEPTVVLPKAETAEK